MKQDRPFTAENVNSGIRSPRNTIDVVDRNTSMLFQPVFRPTYRHNTVLNSYDRRRTFNGVNVKVEGPRPQTSKISINDLYR